MRARPALTFDSLLKELGDFGPYQIKTVLLLCLAAGLLNAWTFFDLVFLLYAPEKSCKQWNVNATHLHSTLGHFDHDCKYEGQELSNPDSAIEKVIVHCENWTIDKRYFENTVNTQWGICQNQALLGSIMLIFTVIGIAGHIIMSMLQDIIGRKLTFLISVTFTVAGSGLSLLAPSLTTWVVLRGIQATQGSITYSVPFIWAQEFAGPEKRTLVNFLMTLVFSMSTVSLGLVAWACNTWIQLGLITSTPFLAFYSYYFLVDESPRWLLSVGKVDQATAVVEKIAKWNKKESELPLIRSQVAVIAESLTPEKIEPKEKSSWRTFQPLQLLRFPDLRLKLILLTAIWIANSLAYTSLAFNAPNLGNIFVAYIVQASVEAPACVINLLLSNRIGRIPPIVLSMIGGAFFCLMCIPAYIKGLNEWYIIIFAALAKFGICISYNILYQAAGELYPTSLRGTGIGINNMFGDSITGVMPYVLAMATTGKWIPMLILGVVVLFGAVCCCFLPEPMNQPMPLTAAEAENVSKVGVARVKEHVISLIKCSVRSVSMRA